MSDFEIQLTQDVGGNLLAGAVSGAAVGAVAGAGIFDPVTVPLFTFFGGVGAAISSVVDIKKHDKELKEQNILRYAGETVVDPFMLTNVADIATPGRRWAPPTRRWL